MGQFVPGVIPWRLSDAGLERGSPRRFNKHQVVPLRYSQCYRRSKQRQHQPQAAASCHLALRRACTLLMLLQPSYGDSLGAPKETRTRGCVQTGRREHCLMEGGLGKRGVTPAVLKLRRTEETEGWKAPSRVSAPVSRVSGFIALLLS